MSRSLLVPALLAAGALCAEVAARADEITVPGGTQAIVNLLGHMDQAPDRFVGSLNRVLLTTANSKHDWKETENRLRLVQYLEDVEKLRKVFPDRLVIGTASKPARKAFIKLAGELGYKAKFKKGRFDLVPADGDDKERRRRLGAALGIDLHRFAAGFEGDTVEIEFVVDQVELPISFAAWGALVGKKLDLSKPLETLAKDQRFGLILEGKRRWTEPLLDSLGQEFPSWSYDRAPATFYRYASTFEIESGDLLVPGGQDASPVWQAIVGERPEDAGAFVRELLTRKDGRAAYLWHAMHFAKPEKARYYLGTGSASLGEDRRYVKKVFGKLDNTATGAFDRRYGGDLGFSVLVRSIPLSPDGSSLALPGGTGIWFQAIKGNRPPRNREQLAREVEKGNERTLDDGDFILKALTEETDMDKWKAPVLPRLIRTVNFFGDDRVDLLSPENVVLLARASDHFPAALEPLEDLEPTRAAVVEDYLLAVGHLSEVPVFSDRELLTINFQGGIEWLRGLTRAGKVPPSELEERLERWSRLHGRMSSPAAAAPLELEWIASLLRSLPPAEDAAPGRGPLERAMIQALVPPLNMAFEWQDLEYAGQRGDDLMAAMARNLEAQEIPPADLLVEIFDGVRGLEAAIESQDLDETHRLAKALRSATRSLPKPSFVADVEEKAMLRRVSNVDRDEIESVLDKLLAVKKAKKLARRAESVEAIEQHLAADLRSFLLAPAYLLAMGDQVDPLLRDSGLIRKHLMIDVREGSKNVDRSWLPARVEQDELEQLGTYLHGSLATIPRALSDFNLGSSSGGDDAADANLGRARQWYSDLVKTAWHQHTAEEARLVSELRMLGEALIAGIANDSEAADDRLTDLVRRVVPSARLERVRSGSSLRSLVSPSDMVAVALGAIEQDLVGTGERGAFDDAARAVGPEWRVALNRFGTATPHLNGKTRPWVGAWPSYEAVERESRPAALSERQLLDSRITMFDYLGRRGLPGGVGADLMRKTLEVAIRDLRLETDHDWESWLQWIAQVDDDFLDARMRECLQDGLYRLTAF